MFHVRTLILLRFAEVACGSGVGTNGSGAVVGSPSSVISELALDSYPESTGSPSGYVVVSLESPLDEDEDEMSRALVAVRVFWRTPAAGGSCGASAVRVLLLGRLCMVCVGGSCYLLSCCCAPVPEPRFPVAASSDLLYSTVER